MGRLEEEALEEELEELEDEEALDDDPEEVEEELEELLEGLLEEEGVPPSTILKRILPRLILLFLSGFVPVPATDSNLMLLMPEESERQSTFWPFPLVNSGTSVPRSFKVVE